MDSEYTLANGPEDLLEKLNALPSGREHLILYKLNQQQSLLKIDTSEPPYKVWYYDLMGRAATEAVKTAVSQFLNEKCNVPSTDTSNFIDLFKRQALLDASLGKIAAMRPENPLQQGLSELRACQRTSNLRSSSLFASKPNTPNQSVTPDPANDNFRNRS